MKRLLLALGILGLVGTAPANAQQITLFGKTYNLVKESRAQTYKKQGGGTVTIAVAPREESLQLGSLNFVEGADPSQDRIFVASNINTGEDLRVHQFYQMTGTDANGVFTKDSATVTEYFGGASSPDQGGRPTGHIWLNDLNTGVGQDRNIAISTFSGDDWYRLFDFDKMNGVAASLLTGEDQTSDQVFGISQGDEEANSPGTSYTNYARFPQWDNRTVVVFAQNNGGTGVTVWDTRQNKMFPIVTNLQEVTASATKPFPAEVTQIFGVFHHSGNEYWIMGADAAFGNPSTAPGSVKIYRTRLTFPTDLTQSAPGSIKAEVLDVSQELMGSALHAAVTDGSGIYGMAKGREVAPGLFRLYFGDADGNIFTATPVP